MSLGPGAHLGPYEVISAIGSGGMGEVYRARDTRLHRDVAIKVLPETLATDPDRLARFEREAQLLASLNHPHIAAIYGLEDRALVLELVEGETLADRIARGPISVDEAIPIARQLAEALGAAHEQGIIHRDLKPSNIKVTAAGTVKVLDFGLAKFTEPSVSNTSNAPNAFSVSPTITSPMMTGVGVLLGTAAYMAPEQAKGRPADKRSDIWAFGCVLYEMLTGKRPFGGEDVTDVLVAVLSKDPDWSALPGSTPAGVRTLLKRCLERDSRKRIGDISTALFVFDEGAALSTVGVPVTAPHDTVWRRVAMYGIPALLLGMAVAGGVSLTMGRTPASTTRFFVYPPEKATFVTNGRAGTTVSISPDGSTLAFTARDLSGKVMLWIRPIDSLTAQALPGTDDAKYPFWSPDSRFIAFFAQQKLQKIAANGGPPQTLCNIADGRGGTWSQNGTIVFNPGPSGTLSRVSSAGGQPLEFMRPANGQTGYAFPWFLPDGRHFLFYAYASTENVAGIYVGALDAPDSRRLLGADTAAVYDSQNARLLFVRQGTLLAQPFDPTSLALAGESFPVAERVEDGVTQAIAAFSVSKNGTLAYGVGVGAGAGVQMSWFDRQGKQVEAVGPAGNYRGIDLSPDGRHIAVHRHDGRGGDIWVTDLSRNTTSRFTFDASQENSSPIWSPDGTRIVYGSSRNGKWGLYQKLANNAGSEERLVESGDPILPMSWSPNENSIAYESLGPKTLQDLWMLSLSGNRKPSPLLRTPFNESHGQSSPDGKWLAYYSTETGRSEVYVLPFPSGAGKWQVSTNGGFFPRWRRDGRELFYMSQTSGGKMMAVDVRSGGSTFEPGTPKELFDSPYINLSHTAPYHTFAVSADGQRFLIPHPPSSDTANLTMPIAVVENWAAALAK